MRANLNERKSRGERENRGGVHTLTFFGQIGLLFSTGGYLFPFRYIFLLLFQIMPPWSLGCRGFIKLCFLGISFKCFKNLH